MKSPLAYNAKSHYRGAGHFNGSKSTDDYDKSSPVAEQVPLLGGAFAVEQKSDVVEQKSENIHYLFTLSRVYLDEDPNSATVKALTEFAKKKTECNLKSFRGLTDEDGIKKMEEDMELMETFASEFFYYLDVVIKKIDDEISGWSVQNWKYFREETQKLEQDLIHFEKKISAQEKKLQKTLALEDVALYRTYSAMRKIIKSVIVGAQTILQKETQNTRAEPSLYFKKVQ